jgi:hypothetical protein
MWKEEQEDKQDVQTCVLNVHIRTKDGFITRARIASISRMPIATISSGIKIHIISTVQMRRVENCNKGVKIREAEINGW